MSQPVSPFQRQPVPPPGSIRRDTPDPLPEPQIWAAIASVGALFAFFGTVLPWFLPEPRGAASGGLLSGVPTYIGGLALTGVLGSWMLVSPTMRRRGAYVIATLCVLCAAGGFAFAFAKWVARQSLLANSAVVAGEDHGHPLLGMWMFLIGAIVALVLGAAALARLRAGPPARPAPPPGRGPYRAPPPPPAPPGGGRPHPNLEPKPELARSYHGHPVNPVLPPYRGLSPQTGGATESAGR